MMYNMSPDLPNQDVVDRSRYLCDGEIHANNDDDQQKEEIEGANDKKWLLKQ